MKDTRSIQEGLDEWNSNEKYFEPKFLGRLFVMDITFPVTKQELKLILS